MNSKAFPIAPSGRQISIACGDHRATVVEVGGGLRSYELGDWAVLDGYSEQEQCGGGRGQLLLPWPNRIEDGSYEFDGALNQLALSEPPNQNAIHGLARWASWEVAEQGEDRATMDLLLHPQSGYPFTLLLEASYLIDEVGLTVEVTATNAGTGPCPYGAGMHPYLSLGAPTIDAAHLEVPAAAYLTADDRSIPRGIDPVERTEFDFRAAREIGDTVLDTCFTELDRDGDGRARVVLSDPDGTRRVTLWADEAVPYLMVFSGDTLPESERRRGLAVEPMTCAPNAFRSGDGLRVLEPEESATARWGIEPAAG